MTFHSDPLTRPCLNPECPPVLDQARAYVRKKLDGAFLRDYTSLKQSPAYQQVKAAIGQAMAEGSLDKTKAACRLWCKVVIGWTRDHHAVVEAAPASEERVA